MRADDTLADLERKVRLASALGTWPATLTQWSEDAAHGLRPIWRHSAVDTQDALSCS